MWGVLLDWVIGLVEVIGIIGAILLAGLVIAVAAFWSLSRLLSLRGDPSSEFEPDDVGSDDYRGAKVIPIRPEESKIEGK